MLVWDFEYIILYAFVLIARKTDRMIKGFIMYEGILKFIFYWWDFNASYFFINWLSKFDVHPKSRKNTHQIFKHAATSFFVIK